MATRHETTGLTYADLETFPDDNLRRELIEGELHVNPAPSPRHQRVVRRLASVLNEAAERAGGEMFFAPLDVVLSEADVVQPDLLVLTAEHADRVQERSIHGAPDIVAEVSSPFTHKLDIVRKRDLYERYRVPEYWYVDVEGERVELYRLGGDVYGAPVIFMRSDEFASPILPGFSLSVDELLGAPDD